MMKERFEIKKKLDTSEKSVQDLEISNIFYNTQFSDNEVKNE